MKKKELQKLLNALGIPETKHKEYAQYFTSKLTHSTEIAIKERMLLKKLQPANPKFKVTDSRRVLTLHSYLLRHYIEHIVPFLEAFYKESWWITKLKLLRILGGKKEFNKIISGGRRIAVKEIFLIHQKLKLRKDFGEYFISKTMLSLSVFSFLDINPVVNPRIFATRGYAFKIKFAEFVHIILSEYIILSNYMWASGHTISGIHSIDNTWFLKNIDPIKKQPKKLLKKRRR